MTFPNRPNHPDFWLMAEIVQDMDAAAEDKVGLQRIIGDIDLQSLAYVAEQRAMRAAMWAKSDPLASADPIAQLGGMWIDAFKAGVEFQKRRNS